MFPENRADRESRMTQPDLAYTYGKTGQLGHLNQPNSVAAAARALPKASSWAGKVLTEFHIAGARGLTDEELAARLEGYASSRPRRIGLTHLRWLRDSGRKRKTRSGCDATVWVIAK